jgi:hypothetical protein
LRRPSDNTINLTIALRALPGCQSNYPLDITR